MKASLPFTTKKGKEREKSEEEKSKKWFNLQKLSNKDIDLSYYITMIEK